MTHECIKWGGVVMKSYKRLYNVSGRFGTSQDHQFNIKMIAYDPSLNQKSYEQSDV
jgi:hypothetical protein